MSELHEAVGPSMSLRRRIERALSGRLGIDGKDPSGGPWMHLVWLGFLFLPLTLGAPFEWLATGVAVAVFLALHFLSFHQSGPRLWLSRLIMFGIGVALFPYNAFAHTFFIYAGIPGARAKARESIAIITVTVIASYAYFTWHGVSGIYFGAVSVVLLGLGISILAARANRVAQLTIAGKDLEIERLAKVAERERIARDLHDLLGHTLSLIAIKAELAHKLAPDESSRSAAEMREVADVAREALTEVRQAIAGLRSIGLLDAIRASTAMLRAAGLDTTVQFQSLPSLSTIQESALAQAVLEASTNIARHAEATRVSISISCENANLCVQVDDNGRGGHIRPGNGLIGMRERLKAVNGEISFLALQPGTRLTASLPLTLDKETV